MNKKNKLTSPDDTLVMIELSDEELAGITGGCGHNCNNNDNNNDDNCNHHHHHHCNDNNDNNDNDCWDDNNDCNN